MNKKIRLNQLLTGARLHIRFDDGDAERVWDRARNANARRANPIKLLIPVAAACTVLVTLAAVPQARAEVVRFFGRVFSAMDYMNMDKNQRPENSSVAMLLQTVNPTVAATTALQDGDWTKEVKIGIDEVLYDGQYVYVKYTVDAAGLENFMQYPTPTEGQDVPYKEFMPDNKLVCGSESLPRLQYGQQPLGDGKWQDIAQYDAAGLADKSGQVDLVFTILFNNMLETTEAGYCTPAGKTDVSFQLNLISGKNASAQAKGNTTHPLSGEAIVTDEIIDVKQDSSKNTITFTNRRIRLEECSIFVDSLTVSPTEIHMNVHFISSEQLASLDGLTMCKAVNIDIFDGGKVIGTWTRKSPDGKNGAYLELSAQMPPEGLKSVTLVTRIWHETSVKGIPLEIDKPFTAPFLNGEDLGQSKPVGGVEVSGGTFEVIIPK